MSHSHVRVKEPPPQRNLWLEAVVGVGALLLIVLIIGVRLWYASFDTNRLIATGKVSETRIVVDHIFDGLYGGQVFFRIEAHVSYELDGQAEDRWLTASEVTTARELLVAKLATNPKTCQVYSASDHPENARCRFQ